MDAIEMLKADHEKAKGLFRDYEKASDKRKKKQIAEQVFQELEVHSKLEEEIFYPAVREKADRQGQELVQEGLEEHHVVDVLIGELRALDPQDDNFDAKFKVLTENVEHHIEEEEKEMLPDAEKLLRDDLERLGEQMQARKDHLMSIMA